MKKKYVFEIQNCITVFSWGDTSEEARRELIENIDDWSSEMCSDCYISDGEEVHN